jgi:hypothetical protein
MTNSTICNEFLDMKHLYFTPPMAYISDGSNTFLLFSYITTGKSSKED